MRISLPAAFLSLAVVLTYSAASAMAGPPSASSMPGPHETTEVYEPASVGACLDGEQCTAPAGVFRGLCGRDDCCPRWSFAAEGIALQRSNTRPQPLLIPLDSLGVDVVDAQHLDFPVAFGFDVSAIRHDILGCDLEIRYFQLDGFEAHENLRGPSLIVTDVNGTNLDGLGLIVENAEVRYKSALYNAELNLRHCWTDRLTLLAGIRIVEIDEHYSAGGNPLFGGVLPDLVPIGVTPSLLEINTYNHLYGFQLGAEAVLYDRCGPLQVKGLCKAGIYDNLAFQNYRRAEIEIYDPAFGAQRDQAAFLGEAGLVATYAVTERLAFRASATAMWINGVALAPEQIQSVDLRSQSATISTSGSLFYYGGGLGLEYRF